MLKLFSLNQLRIRVKRYIIIEKHGGIINVGNTIRRFIG